MKLEEMKEYRFDRITVVGIVAFFLAALLVVANEVLDIPFVVFNAPPTPINWMEIG